VKQIFGLLPVAFGQVKGLGHEPVIALNEEIFVAGLDF